MSSLIRRLLLPLLLLLPLGNAALAAPQLDLAAYKGKVVYIDFWASWCGPCRQSFPWMKDMQAKYGRDGFVIIAINVDQEKKLADKFLAEFNPAFTVLFDSNGTLASQFKVQTMPSSFMLDRNGQPRFKHLGFHEGKRADYEQEITQLLSEKS
ncbi:MAG: TlpA disulfide reductase family protein [bacterium]|nr:TlpA disulfide reductase family protein [bacterium]